MKEAHLEAINGLARAKFNLTNESKIDIFTPTGVGHPTYPGEINVRIELRIALPLRIWGDYVKEHNVTDYGD